MSQAGLIFLRTTGISCSPQVADDIILQMANGTNTGNKTAESRMQVKPADTPDTTLTITMRIAVLNAHQH